MINIECNATKSWGEVKIGLAKFNVIKFIQKNDTNLERKG